jgi:hypothetical protein
MPPDNLATMSLSPDQELVRCSPIEGSGQLKSRKQMVSSVNGWIPTNFEVWRQMVRRLPNCQNDEIAARLRDRTETQGCHLPGVSPPPRPGQAADRRWKPDSSTVRPRSSVGTALAAAYTHCRPDPTSRRSGSPAAPAPLAVDTRWRPDPTTPRSGSRAAAPSRLPELLATGRRLAQGQPSRLPNDE